MSKGTQVNVPLVGKLEDGRWQAAVAKQEGNRIRLSVNSPATAAVGRYQLTVETTCSGGHALSTHSPANDVYILFNPWCEGKMLLVDRFSYFEALLVNKKAPAPAPWSAAGALPPASGPGHSWSHLFTCQQTLRGTFKCSTASKTNVIKRVRGVVFPV